MITTILSLLFCYRIFLPSYKREKFPHLFQSSIAAQLPTELLLTIFELIHPPSLPYIQQRTYVELSGVCRTWKTAANILLYRKVSVCQLSDVKLFVRTLKSSTTAGSLVTRLNLSGVLEDHNSSFISRMMIYFGFFNRDGDDLFFAVVQKCPNIRELIVHPLYRGSSDLAPPPHTRDILPNLRSLTINNWGGKCYHWLGVAILAGTVDLPSLEDFALTGWAGDLSNPCTSIRPLPALVSLHLEGLSILATSIQIILASSPALEAISVIRAVILEYGGEPWPALPNLRLLRLFRTDFSASKTKANVSNIVEPYASSLNELLICIDDIALREWPTFRRLHTLRIAYSSPKVLPQARSLINTVSPTIKYLEFFPICTLDAPQLVECLSPVRKTLRFLSIMDCRGDLHKIQDVVRWHMPLLESLQILFKKDLARSFLKQLPATLKSLTLYLPYDEFSAVVAIMFSLFDCQPTINYPQLKSLALLRSRERHAGSKLPYEIVFGERCKSLGITFNVGFMPGLSPLESY